jgi:hypothetical protein
MSNYKGNVTKDQDGTVNINDAQYILNWISAGGNMNNLGPVTYSVNGQSYHIDDTNLADVTGDSSVNINDAQYILNWISAGGNMNNLGPVTYSVNGQSYEITQYSTGPDPTGIITVKTSYKDLGAGLGNGLEISLECDTERDITGFDLRFDETGQSSSWKYLKLENATHNAVTVNPSASGTVFDNNTDWYITNNSGNHPNDGLTRINGFTGESTNNSGTWTFNNKITITANVPLTLMKLLPGTNTDQNNLPQLVYADLVKTVGGELYNDDKDDNNASIVVIDTTAVVTPLAQSVIIQN